MKTKLFKLQFPKNFRFITERFKKSKGEIKKIGKIFVLVSLVSLIFFAATDLTLSYHEKDEIENKRNALSSQVKYWEGLVEEEKGYRDGYFMLSALNYQLKDLVKSKNYLEKVLLIDPNFSPAIELQKVIDREE